MSEEFELTLRVCVGDPVSLFRAVAGLRSLGPYELSVSGASSVYDRYFDTDRGSLMGSGLALRLRQEGDRTCLGIKGKERIDPQGAIRRLEIEGPWSKNVLTRVLEASGLTSLQVPTFLPQDPAGTLSSLGLRVIQRRLMERTRMHVVDARVQNGGIAGELALDTVHYQTAGVVFTHHEIEIEASSHENEGMVADLAEFLQKEFPGALCRWDHNKLITGLALQALAGQYPARTESPEEIVVSGQWFKRIEDWIRMHRDVRGKEEHLR